jgi:hypothetical protein
VAAPLCSQAADERKLEVFSWWTSGGEAAALDVLFKVYKAFELDPTRDNFVLVA